MKIAADIDVYSNHDLTWESLDLPAPQATETDKKSPISKWTQSRKGERTLQNSDSKGNQLEPLAFAQEDSHRPWVSLVNSNCS